MKLSVISDSHGFKFDAEPCDVLIHCGDMTGRGTYHETISMAKYLRDTAKADHILIVPGNHDLCFEEDLETMRHDVGSIDNRVTILVDKLVNIDRVSFYGSPWTPPFFQWAFMLEEPALAKKFATIPETLDVLITHGPPRGILDPGYKDPHVGSTALLEAVQKRHIRHHFFGHLHGAGGKGSKLQDLDTIFHNVAMVDDRYKPQRGPLTLEIEALIAV